ncbi:MAG: hypothetical protein SXQ77_03210, partial [Halobacteria archaeon]|nr:hypothetical protein [Halobacteria archaeon]
MAETNDSGSDNPDKEEESMDEEEDIESYDVDESGGEEAEDEEEQLESYDVASDDSSEESDESEESEEFEETEAGTAEEDENTDELDVGAGDEVGEGDEEDASDVINETFESRDPRDMMDVDDVGIDEDEDEDEVTDTDVGTDTPGTDVMGESEEPDEVEAESGFEDDTDTGADDFDTRGFSEGDLDDATDTGDTVTAGDEMAAESVEVDSGEGETGSGSDSDSGIGDLGDSDLEDVAEELGGGGGGDGIVGMESGEIDQMVEEASDVTEFFEGRSSGDVGGELEGFFEAEGDLSDEFGDDKLEVLLSEAKQGVAEFEDVEGFVEHERYWVNKPYAYIAILYSDAENDYRYWVVEPQLDEFEESVRRDLEERLRDVLMYEDIDSEKNEEEVLEDKAKRIIDDYGIDIETDSVHKILYYLKRDYIHDGKIDPIMRDPHIEDISCDGDNVPVFVYHRDYRDLMTNVEFN